MVERQVHLLTLPDMPYFCFPESIGRYTDYPGHSVTREAGSLNNFNIHYVASGRGYVEIDGIAHELQRGQAVLYFPLQEQRYYSSGSEPWDVRWVHFYGRALHDYMLERGLHQHRLWSLRQPADWEEAHLALLAEAETHTMLRPALLSTRMYAALALFVQQAVPLSSQRSGRSENRVSELLPLLQQEARKPFVLQEWAERAGVSPHYFCKLFKREVAMSPMDFVTRARLQLAKQWLLERKDANIGEIAVDVGYPSVSYFNKRFLAHEGMTPSEYRSLYRTADE